MYCLECYAENPEGIKFCQKCGCLFGEPGEEEKKLLKDRYEIISSLAEGGFGGISVAYDTHLNKSCALKEISGDFLKNLTHTERSSIFDSFKKEAELLAKLRHPNLPYVTDYFIENNQCYLVMDYIEGKDFELILDEEGEEGLEEKRVLEWSIQICRILEYLHGQTPPVMHGDIKSANLIVRNSDGWIMLVDFGAAVSRNIKKDKEQTSGTAGYAAPEQYFGILDEKSDIYSLGATIYELLTGTLPEEEFDYSPVRDIKPDISQEMENIVMKCLKYDHEERYDNSNSLKKDLLSLYQDLYGTPLVKLKTSTLVDNNSSSVKIAKNHAIKPVKVFIVDDDLYLFNTFKKVEHLFKGIDIVGNAYDGKEAIDRLTKSDKKPDVILMDIDMPVMNGITATKKIKEIFPSVKIVMLSVELDEADFMDSLNAGASGYILKTESSWEDLEKTIKKAYDGGMPICPEASTLLINALSSQNNSSLSLSPDHKEVLLDDEDLEIILKICPDCDEENNYEALFCKECGADLSDLEEDGTEFIEEVVFVEEEECEEIACDELSKEEVESSFYSKTMNSDARHYNALGDKYYQSNAVKLALENYEKAIQLEPEYGEAYFNIGSVLFEELIDQGDDVEIEELEKTVFYFKKTIELSPESSLSKEAKKCIEDLNEYKEDIFQEQLLEEENEKEEEKKKSSLLVLESEKESNEEEKGDFEIDSEEQALEKIEENNKLKVKIHDGKLYLVKEEDEKKEEAEEDNEIKEEAEEDNEIKEEAEEDNYLKVKVQNGKLYLVKVEDEFKEEIEKNEGLPTEVFEENEDLSTEVVEEIEDLSTEVVEEIEDLSTEVVEEVEDLSTEDVEEIEDLPTEVVEENEDLPTEVVEEIEDLPTEVVEEIEDLPTEDSEEKEEHQEKAYIDEDLPESLVHSIDDSEMILIPAGEFTMGSTQDEVYKAMQEAREYYKAAKLVWFEVEMPSHKVYLDSYYIDKTPVTNKQYNKFIDDCGYESQGNWKSFYSPDKENHPVVNITWDDAKAYADWAGKRLPTEAEWEKASRGEDGREWSWNDQWDESKCNSRFSTLNTTTPVDSFPGGASVYGVLDMPGNVWEWCNDWYDEKYYAKSPKKNPHGPEKGKVKVIRGGSWTNYPYYLRTSSRYRAFPDNCDHSKGFRCVKSHGKSIS